MKKLPVYEALVDNESTGIYTISLVTDPAVESDFLYFSENKPMKFSVEDEEKRLIRGVIMECDKLIYRRDASDFEYYIKFNEQTIRVMAQKYLKDGFQSNVDLQHSGDLINGVEMVQWFISDKENGINPAGFEDIADHSLFAEFKVNNDEVWDEIKEGTFKGFSLAGLFDTIQVEMSKKKENVLDQIENLIETISKKIK